LSPLSPLSPSQVSALHAYPRTCARRQNLERNGDKRNPGLR